MRTSPTGAILLMAQALVSPVPPHSGAPPPQSAPRSPIPYLYGGFATMFGLVTLALFILAYSYFSNSRSRDEEGGSQKSVTNRRHQRAPYVEQFVVIMAGDSNPSFLATPIPVCSGTSDAVDIETNGEDDRGKTDGDGDETEPH